MTVTITGPTRANGALNLPADVSELLRAFGLTLADVLTASNPKLGKGADVARSVILHHLPERALSRAIDPGTVAATAPRGYLPDVAALAAAHGLTARARFHNGCPFATAGCAAACLNAAGHGGLSVDVASCRARRTLASIADPVTYGRAVAFAIARERARTADGLPLAVRLRGTDETAWHLRTFPVSVADAQAIRRRFGVAIDPGPCQTIADAFATERAAGRVILYEYSKAPLGGAFGLEAQRSAGWHVTASFAADRETACADAVAAIRAGFAVAIPVAIGKREPLPARVAITPRGQDQTIIRAIDGDSTDHRWGDATGPVAVLLREKRARGADRSAVDRFVLPNAPATRLADGLVQLLRD